MSEPSDEPGEGQEGQGELSQMDALRELFGRFAVHSRDVGDPHAEPEVKSKPEQLLSDLTVEGIADYMKGEKCKNVIIMSGAGISTSAGIPDFRSPGTGLYDNLAKYNLPNPQAIFEIGFFRENPEPFFALSKELFPGKFYPTPCHYFIRLLNDKGLLLRHFTQNIDTLDRAAGVPDEKIMEAHGSFYTGHCLNASCHQEYSEEWMRNKIMEDLVPKCEKCNEDSVVKPDIVFFGESLPPKFFPLVKQDFPKCDLLIVMGTSLVVQPFASLIDEVPETTPRLLINREKSGQTDPLMMMLGMGNGMDFDSDSKYRDVAYIGSCDDGCRKLAELLGWKDDMDKLLRRDKKLETGDGAKGAAVPDGEKASAAKEAAPGDSKGAAANL